MARKNRMERRKERSREQWEEHRAAMIVYILLRCTVVLAMVSAMLRGAWESVFICVLTLILFSLPALIERNFRVDLPDTLEIVVLFFIFATQILGEVAAWYVLIPNWDTLMHTMNGFLAAAIGFCLVDLLNRSERVGLNLSPLYLSLVAFCFSMTVGVIWEFFEFAMDYFFLHDMQKDTVIHTISSLTLDPAAQLGYDAYLSPLVFAAAGVLPSAVTWSRRELSVRQMLLRMAIQLAMVEALVLLIAYRSPMIPTGEPGVVPALAGSVVLIYVLVTLFQWLLDRAAARKMTRDLLSWQGRAEP